MDYKYIDMNNFFALPPEYILFEEKQIIEQPVHPSVKLLDINPINRGPPSVYLSDKTFSVRDDCVTHCTSVVLPFHSIMSFVIPSNKITDIHSISDKIKYDPPSKTLTAYCDSIAHNMILLYLAAKITMGEMTTNTVIKKKLVSKYFRGKGKSPTRIKKSLMRLVYENYRKYKK